MKKEQRLILLSALTNKCPAECTEIDGILAGGLDWIEIGGVLLNHRLGGYFYQGLSKEQLTKVPKEILKNLQMIVKGQTAIQEYNGCFIQELKDTLEGNGLRYAGVKGVFFGTELYPIGIRRSNDIDLLVYEEDLEKLDELLRSIGYIQSLLPDGQLIEATRKEKVIQRMNYHDLVPYIKVESNNLIEIDINFLFDGKDNLIEQKVFARGTKMYEGTQYSFRGLDILSELAFLVSHFYREAYGELWVKNKRNLTLYKIVDIINFIRYYRKDLKSCEFVKLIQEYNLLEKTLYTFFVLREFYDDMFVNECIELIQQHVSHHNFSEDLFKQYFVNSFNLGRI